MFQTRTISVVADAADGADGVTQLVLVYNRYPDCARSKPPLAAEGNFNPYCAQEGLWPAQPASKGAGAFWPASPTGADLQKVRCASRPLCSIGHELTHVDFDVASGRRPIARGIRGDGIRRGRAYILIGKITLTMIPRWYDQARSCARSVIPQRRRKSSTGAQPSNCRR